MVAICAAVGLMILGWKLRQAEQAYLARPTVYGKITSIEVVKKAKEIASAVASGGMQEHWFVEVSYEYVVNAQTYVGHRLSNSSSYESALLHKNPSQKLTGYLQKYPVGSSVPVHYSVRLPDKAFLEIDTCGSKNFALAGSLSLLLGVAALVSSYRVP